MLRRFAPGLAAAALAGLAVAGMRVDAQSAAALTGTVTSPQEGRMEGVLVTVRREGANFDVTVVSNDKGEYSFPRTHMAPGKYAVKIRAVGFDLASPAPVVDVSAAKAATLNLALDTAKDLSSQITSVEWLMSIPGTDEEKNMVQKQIASCTYCHSLERVIKSRHNADQMVNVIHRMAGYYFDGTVAGTEGRGRNQPDTKAARDGAAKNPSWGFAPGVEKTKLAAYLATVNRSAGRELPRLQTLPRPKGKATKVIVTQYDMPRKDTVPHDSDVDSKGAPWYTDQSDYYVGTMDPKTGVFKEWPLPRAQHHEFGGASDIQVDRKDRLWFSVTTDKANFHFGQPGVFDPKTGEYRFADVPDGTIVQFLALAPDGDLVAGGLKIDVETTKIVDRFDYMKSPNRPPGPHMGYEPAMDSKGNWYITDFGGSYIIKVDGKTKEAKFFKTPTAFSQPRRGRMDPQDRFWFGEYTGDNLGMFDTRTEKFEEYPTGKWTGPYAASIPDKGGRVYVSSGASDRVYRVDSKTREVIGYLMPTRDFDSKQVTIDPVNQSTVWLANTRNARLIKIEPLD